MAADDRFGPVPLRHDYLWHGHLLYSFVGDLGPGVPGVDPVADGVIVAVLEDPPAFGGIVVGGAEQGLVAALALEPAAFDLGKDQVIDHLVQVRFDGEGRLAQGHLAGGQGLGPPLGIADPVVAVVVGAVVGVAAANGGKPLTSLASCAIM